MIIKSIAASLPSRVVNNDDIVEMIREQSTAYEGDIDRLLKIIRRFLHQSGLEERRWCDRHELPIDHVAKATRAVLSESYLRRRHIDLLIYVGVGRGFLEPGNSHMIASALGFDNAQCFDVVDACMSWVRALHLVDSLFKNGTYKNALIINAEFNAQEGGPLYPKNFNIRTQAELLYTFPTFTIGEAATATLVIPEEPNNFHFHFSARPELSDLCTIPMEGYHRFCHPSEKIGQKGAMQFTSYGINLHQEGQKEVRKVFNKLSNPKEIAKVFVHASSKKEWDEAGTAVGVTDKIFHTYPWTGNIVSASVPTAIASAINQQQLLRGDDSVIWVGSAGMSYNVTRFRY